MTKLTVDEAGRLLDDYEAFARLTHPTAEATLFMDPTDGRVTGVMVRLEPALDIPDPASGPDARANDHAHRRRG